MALLSALACSSTNDAPDPKVQPEADASDRDATTRGDAATDATAAFDRTSYDRSCTYNEDCQPVPTVPCDSCVCTDLAIRSDGYERYFTDLRAQATREGCGDLALPGYPCAEDATVCDRFPMGACESGQCEVRPDRTLDVTQYDRACATDDDCVGVNESLCTGGSRCTSAIAKTAKAQFDADRAASPPCGIPAPVTTPLSCGIGVRCSGGQCFRMPDEVP